MDYLEQPAFGQLVGRLRRERGLSQAEIAGEGVSSSYVSRLESGRRAPTLQAVRHFAARLDVPEDTFQARSPQVLATRIAEGVAALEDGRFEVAVTALDDAAAEAHGATPEMLWQVLWNLARAYEQLGRHTERQRVLARVLAVGEQLGSPTLQAKALIGLAGCARLAGEVDQSIALAGQALTLGDQYPEISRVDVAQALLALIAAETEAGRLADAAQHAEQAGRIPAEEIGPLRVRVLWTAATVAVRQGAGSERGLALLEEALAIADRRDLLTWGRLRLAAVSLRLRTRQEATSRELEWFREAESAIGLIGDRGHLAELTAVAARLAFHRGEPERAAALAREALEVPDGLDLQDRMRTEILLRQVEIGLGPADEAVCALQSIAEELQSSGNLDLATEAWKALAEALVHTRR